MVQTESSFVAQPQEKAELEAQLCTKDFNGAEAWNDCGKATQKLGERLARMDR